MAAKHSKNTYKHKISTAPAFKITKEFLKAKEEKKKRKRIYKEEQILKRLVKEKKIKLEEEAKEERLKTEQQQLEIREEKFYTVAIALPGSILDNAQSPELRTYMAGQIARAAAIFNVNEIIIFDESGKSSKTTDGNYTGVGRKGNANVQMGRILQYLECPQYLRKAFFPRHRDLQHASLLNPMRCPHHMKADEETPYRDGVVCELPVKDGKGSYVDVGLTRRVQVDKKIQAGMRVTVKMEPDYMSKLNASKVIEGCVVSPCVPFKEDRIYWGYNVRLASSLGAVFTESPHPGGYDVLIGTSENGKSVDECSLEKFKHLLVVFGGLKGLEYSLDADEDLQIDDPSLLFHHYINTCPNQGSSTIRTEEAILVTMSAIRPMIVNAQQRSTER